MQVPLRDAASVAGVDQLTDAVQQALAGGRFQRAVVRVRQQEVDVGLGGVRDLLREPERLHPAEHLELPCVRGCFGIGRLPQAGRCGRIPAFVAVLDLDEEVAAAARRVVRGDESECSVRAKRVRHLGESRRGIEPVERGRGHHQVERLPGQGPLLELGHLDARPREGPQVAPRHRRHRWTQFHGGDSTAQLGDRDRQLAGTGAEFEYPAVRVEAHAGGQRPDQGGWIGGPRPVVQLGVLVEDATQ